MQVIHHKKELKSVLQKEQKLGKRVGLVPTMGALHDGHLSLVRQSVLENELTVVSIFVNPTQFDNAEDLEKYPANLVQDIALLKTVSKDIFVFAPTKADIYDGEVKSRAYEFNGLDQVMEGAFRTGHFEGVATIVELLFRAVGPQKAYFGEKDYQQLQIITQLVAQLQLPLTIVPCPIARESNGLARSSRNERLSEPTRALGGFIHDSLLTAKSKFGTENALTIKEWVSTQFKNHPVFELEYFEIAEANTLAPIVKKQENTKYRAFIAVYAEGIRLIDNISLN